MITGESSTKLNYSTSEQVVGRWIDGKLIYRKTVFIGTLPNASELSIPHGIINLKMVVKNYGFGYSPNRDLSIPLPAFVWADHSNAIGVFIDSSNIRIRANGDRTYITQSYITLEYTKTPV